MITADVPTSSREWASRSDARSCHMAHSRRQDCAGARGRYLGSATPRFGEAVRFAPASSRGRHSCTATPSSTRRASTGMRGKGRSSSTSSSRSMRRHSHDSPGARVHGQGSLAPRVQSPRSLPGSWRVPEGIDTSVMCASSSELRRARVPLPLARSRISVHSGSDKFRVPRDRQALAGRFHVKTAGRAARALRVVARPSGPVPRPVRARPAHLRQRRKLYT